MKTLVSIQRLNVSYGETVALKNANLDIYDGDFLGIIGPNGGGKTTLIKAILKRVNYSGDIKYDASLMHGQILSGIGYLPQQNSFDTKFPISVMEVVMSGLQGNKGFGKSYSSSDKKRTAEMLSEIGLSGLENRPIGELSGGQLQRTLLCRALISSPRLLILDEPANFVDNKFEKELYDILLQLNDNGIAIVMVSHDIGTITSVVKTIVCVNKHVHRHDSNIITAEQLENYDCPIQLVYHGEVPHTVLGKH